MKTKFSVLFDNQKIEWSKQIDVKSIRDKLFCYTIAETEDFWQRVREARVNYARKLSKSLRELVGGTLAKITGNSGYFETELLLEIQEDKVPFNSEENYINSAEEMMEKSKLKNPLFTTANLVVPEVKIALLDVPQFLRSDCDYLWGVNLTIPLCSLRMVEMKFSDKIVRFFAESPERAMISHLINIFDSNEFNMLFTAIPENGAFDVSTHNSEKTTVTIEENMTLREIATLLRYNGVFKHDLRTLDELFPGYNA